MSPVSAISTFASVKSGTIPFPSNKFEVSQYLAEMTIDFYYVDYSAPCRAVWMTAKALNIQLSLVETKLRTGDNKKPEYLKMNPQHTIPTIKDGDFVLWESRAIMAYLVNKYGKDDSLYPKDPAKRARVDQKLYFDIGTLYQSFADYYYPKVFAKKTVGPEKYTKMEDAFGFLNIALEGQKYAAGDKITIADLALVASVSTFDMAGFPVGNYPNVKRWYEDCKANVIGYDVNTKGVEVFRRAFEHFSQKDD